MHHENLARKNLRAWKDKADIKYRSPHKLRHGHIQYGMAHAKTIADYKAVSMNVLHSSMNITDEVYSQLGDSEIQNRIGALSKGIGTESQNPGDVYELFKEFLDWHEARKNA